MMVDDRYEEPGENADRSEFVNVKTLALITLDKCNSRDNMSGSPPVYSDSMTVDSQVFIPNRKEIGLRRTPT